MIRHIINGPASMKGTHEYKEYKLNRPRAEGALTPSSETTPNKSANIPEKINAIF